MPDSQEPRPPSQQSVKPLPPDDGAVIARQKFWDNARRALLRHDENLERRIAQIKAAPKDAWDLVKVPEDDLVMTEAQMDKLRTYARYFVYLALAAPE